MNIINPKGWLPLLTCASLPLLSACFDDNYDLSDIDTTIGVSINDLVIPVNIEPVTLGTILDIDENDPDNRIHVINGQYMITEDGQFSSDDIRINPIKIAKQNIQPINEQLNLNSGARAGLKFNLPSFLRDFSYTYSNVDEYIKSMEGVKTDFSIGMTLSVNDPSGEIKSMKIHDLTLLLPPGLTGTPASGTYNAANGRVSLGTVTPVNNSVTFRMPVSAISMNSSAASYDAANRKFSFGSSIGLESGSIEIMELSGTAPGQLTINISFDLSELEVKAFTGTFDYSIDGFSIDPIDLSDLPDVLSQKDTRISLANPQIYLHLDNPLAQYRICAGTGLAITPYWGDKAGNACTLDNGRFTIGDPALMQQPGYTPPTEYNYCLSPKAPDITVDGFPNPEHVAYTSLSNILLGDGIPSSLHVNFENPSIDNQRAVDFAIGETFNVNGNYKLCAPLAFNPSTIIAYTDTIDGWNDEDLDNLTVTSLQVSTNVTSTLPLGIELSGYPIDVNGNQINNVTFSTTNIPAGAKNQAVTIGMKGQITHLDGIIIFATASVGSSVPLSPSQTLTLNNIKATVGGSYIKEL